LTGETVEIPGYIAGTWDIDPVHSHVGFVARHLMVSKVRGNFTKFEGQIVTADDPLQSSATLTIDTTSLETSNEQRNGDVRGENFLDVANYPTMSYRSTGVRYLGGTDIVVEGELTIRGITHPVELTAEVNGFGPDPYGGTRVGFSATGELSRSDYGINVDMALPSGGLVISEKIQLTIEVEASLASQ
jgi:polyisoprenoid-binding protein YceI